MTRPKFLPVAVLVFLVALPLWHALIVHNWKVFALACIPEAATGLENVPTASFDNDRCIDGMHGADVHEYYNYFSAYPIDAAGLDAAFSGVRRYFDILGTEYIKRPAFGPISAALGYGWHTLTGIGFPGWMFDILALYAALAVALAYMVFRRAGAGIVVSLAAAGVAATSYAWLPVLSIPESYSLTNLATMAVVYSAVALLLTQERDGRVSAGRLIGHAAVTVVASLLYLPNFGGMAFLLAVRNPGSGGLAGRIAIAAVALFLVLSPSLFLYVISQGLYGFNSQLAYAEEWGTPLNLLHPATWLNSLAAFSVFAIVPASFPLIQVGGAVDWPRFAADPRLWPLFAIGLALVALALRVIVRGWRPGSICFAIWYAALVAFHTFFNPNEVLLYSPVPFAVVFGWLAFSLRGAPEVPVRLRGPALALGAALVLVATANLYIVVGYGGS